MWGSFPYFMSCLKDDRGKPLVVADHHQMWAGLMQSTGRLCLLAPRDHGKTFTALAYVAWRLWRHNRRPDGWYDPSHPDGTYEVVYFSAINDLSIKFFGRLQQFLIDNEEIFSDILPRPDPNAPKAAFRDVWSRTHLRLKNGASCTPKSIGSSSRGLHPQLVICDDILSDKNSLTALQRGRVWSYLMGTIEPMPGPDGQLIVIGTAQHYDDALHRLRKTPPFVWRKFRAVNWDTKAVLWPRRWSYDRLVLKRNQDPVIFSKEYQNDPRDEASSIFPFGVTAGAVARGLNLTMVDAYPHVLRLEGDFVVLSCDLAVSEAVGADYTVVMVALYNRYSQNRRLLYASRERGLTFDDQVAQLRRVCNDFNVDVGVVENNAFQKWLASVLRRYPETASRIFGHTTGIEKQHLADGVPGLKIIFQNELWTVPVGDTRSAEFARIWRSELNAFGYVNGKLEGVGEHDDVVMATWLLERAIRMIEALTARPAGEVIVDMEDEGIERVRIGDY